MLAVPRFEEPYTPPVITLDTCPCVPAQIEEEPVIGVTTGSGFTTTAFVVEVAEHP